jgi:hypothetical protein
MNPAANIENPGSGKTFQGHIEATGDDMPHQPHDDKGRSVPQVSVMG